MSELLEYIAKSLVSKPEAVTVTQTEGPGSVNLELRVAPEDMGKVIGRGGRIAKDIRTVVRTAAAKTDTRVNVEIVDAV
jgi:predicted RNA-binding protein YlqC (UPF0109 family)